MQRKLIVEEWLSLDGYACDKTGKLNFFANYVRKSYTTDYRMDLLDAIDTILFGRNTYVQFSEVWPTRPTEEDILAAKINNLKKIVFSNSLKTAPWGQWPEVTIANGDPIQHVRFLKTLTGKDIVLWGSITLAQTLMHSGMIDEFHLHLCPTLTRGGRKFFTNARDIKNLVLLDTKQFPSGVVLLKYKGVVN